MNDISALPPGFSVSRRRFVEGLALVAGSASLGWPFRALAGAAGPQTLTGMVVNARCFTSAFIGNPWYTIKRPNKQFVGRFFNPAGDVDARWSAAGRVVFEATVVGWIVRGADHNSIR